MISSEAPVQNFLNLVAISIPVNGSCEEWECFGGSIIKKSFVAKGY